jgi:hypothetical protein
MPAHHQIDKLNQTITTTWEGEATDLNLIEALQRYETEVKGKSEYACYHELVNFSGTSSIQLTSVGLLKIAQLAAKSDKSIANTRLAIVVSSTFAFGFAKIYEAYRRYTPRNRKVVRVYKSAEEALAWIKGSE